MSEFVDKVVGKAKEVAGAVTGNKDLEREGKMDQAGAKVKEKTGQAVDKTKEALDDVMDGDDR